MEAFDAAGMRVGKDVLPDDSPILDLTLPGTYNLKVAMAGCTGTCAYGVVAFRR